MPSRILQIIAERVKLLHEPPPKAQQQHEKKTETNKIALEHPKPSKNDNTYSKMCSNYNYNNE